MTNTIEPRVRTARHGRVYPNRIRVFKDPYSYPSWVVYKGPHWVGSAHSRLVANVAVDVLLQNRLIHLGGLNMQELLITMTTHRVAEKGFHELWEPATYGKRHDGSPADVLHTMAAGGAMPHYTVHEDGTMTKHHADWRDSLDYMMPALSDGLRAVSITAPDKPRDFLLNEYGCQPTRDLQGHGIDTTGKTKAWPHP